MSVLVIAEIGSTHDGSVGIALQSIRVAAQCGADAVKFQTHIAAAETTRDAPCPSYFGTEPRYDYFERTAFTASEWRQLAGECSARGVEFISSPFSVQAVELLDELGVSRYKVPSGEVTNTPLLEAINRTTRPVLLSSGMSSWEELDRAVAALPAQDVVMLQCTSEYPCSYERVGLNVLREMRERYDREVGLSDHTATNYAAYAAVGRGAAVIEKHFTLSRHLYGSDAAHSAEPSQFADLVEGIRALEIMLESDVDKSDLRPFHEMRAVFQQSVAARVDIAAGSRIERDMLTTLKPGTGIPPSRLGCLVGAVATRSIDAGRLLAEDDIELPDGDAAHEGRS